ncbi:type II secretion system protein [Aquabacterium sp. OR-4]|uniref:type II secretion system protein n=1 Tax=Aquabacterium sp. OR-4 TaxID=2978127 RepID=UPI0028C99394|nr:type II secretion system protein [Aquabacterium sp. OR-4]MDT7838944.1 type II secretion system protein [Aquabacterium sp. OR-4]
MPTGERPVAPPRRGFTYLVLLFVLALGAAGLGGLATQWQAAGQREREAELLFRGSQIAQALGRYAAATPAGQPRAPQGLDELLDDRRSTPPQQHLRRLYADPFSGHADWVLLRDAQGGIVGLHSRATQRAWRRHALPVAMPGRQPASVGDWHFLTDHSPQTAAPPPTEGAPDPSGRPGEAEAAAEAEAGNDQNPRRTP